MTDYADFRFGAGPPDGWQVRCEARGDLFHSPAWAGIMARGFGAKTLYGWRPGREPGFTVTVFRAGPFAIGYLGFPVGDTALDEAALAALSGSELPLALHGLKLPGRCFSGTIPDGAAREIVLETTIEKLSEWNPARLPKVRRDLARVRRFDLILRDAEPVEASILFGLYRHTVQRAGGTPRYSEGYFQALVEMARTHPQLRCRVAVLDHGIVGFMVNAWHGEAAYYLHGATHPDYQSYSPSDALIHEAITQARDHGLQRFEMLASPADQPGLIRYKEKWGGTTQKNQFLTLPVRENRLRLFEICLASHTRIKSIMTRVAGGVGKRRA